MSYTQKFSVEYQYDVHYTRDLFAADNPLLAQVFDHQARKVMVFIDDQVAVCHPQLQQQILDWAAKHPDQMQLVGPLHIVPGGEQIKLDLAIIEDIGNKMTVGRLCRHSYVLIIGGGAVQDAVGFACSVFHRGIRHIRIPTTVLAQDDSAVGVKNGINHKGIKNFFGCFYPPEAVINDFSFLRTLEQRDILAGVAEALKVALIRNSSFFREMQQEATKIAKAEMSVM